MEGRLENLLSRIAMETQEIKELEQQLTDGQILANEALQRDLKEVICGLQEYLRGLRQQAHRSQQQADRLQAENQRLQRLLEDTEIHHRQLEDTSQTHTQVELSALWMEAQSLRDRQVELEVELFHLREELTHQICEDESHQDDVSLDYTHKTDQIKTRNRDRTRTGIWVGDGGLSVRDQKLFQAPSLGSPGTQDSGLGLQNLSSPDRGRHQEGPPAEGSYWVCVPTTHINQERECVCSEQHDDGVLSNSNSSEAAPPPVPPAGGAPLPCSLSEHSYMGDRCVQEDAEQLKKKKKKLKMETKRLQHKLRRHRCVMQVCDELECLEETLLKRRAELRESDRLLLEAERHTHTTRGQVDVLQLRLQNGASCLLDATHHLRKLRRRRVEEEQVLMVVEEVLRSRHQELKQLNTKIQTVQNRLADVLSDCRDAQRRLDSLTCQEKHEEQRLSRRKEQLREEEQRLASIIKELLQQQGALWSQRRSMISEVREEERLTAGVKLRSHRAEQKPVQEVNRKREELVALQQELDSHRGTTEAMKQQRDNLQEPREPREHLARRRNTHRS